MYKFLYIWDRGIILPACTSRFLGNSSSICGIFFWFYRCFILYFTVEITTHTTGSTIDQPPADPALIAVIVLIACISLALTIICLLHWQRHRLGLKCSFRPQTTDTQFHDISWNPVYLVWFLHNISHLVIALNETVWVDSMNFIKFNLRNNLCYLYLFTYTARTNHNFYIR